MIGHCIVSSNNRVVFNNLMSRILLFFCLKKSAIFLRFPNVFCQFLIFVHSQVPGNLFHGLEKVTA